MSVGWLLLLSLKSKLVCSSSQSTVFSYGIEGTAGSMVKRGNLGRKSSSLKLNGSPRETDFSMNQEAIQLP